MGKIWGPFVQDWSVLTPLLWMLSLLCWRNWAFSLHKDFRTVDSVASKKVRLCPSLIGLRTPKTRANCPTATHPVQSCLYCRHATAVGTSICTGSSCDRIDGCGWHQDQWPQYILQNPRRKRPSTIAVNIQKNGKGRPLPNFSKIRSPKWYARVS